MFDSGFASAETLRQGDTRAIARLLSMIEREDDARLPLLKALHAYGGKAHIIGITGPPGAGKSTLTDKLVGVLRAQNYRVAVAAIDPSSPFTGGAILGDRIRMQRHATDDGVFIRSLATRGHLGGLSKAASEVVRVLDASGYDIVIIETVGVGQSEVDIVRIADTVVLVSVPGLGDDIQAIKAGVMEIGDIFVVNKADKDGAERVVREIRTMLETAVVNGAATRFTPVFEARGKTHAAPAASQNSKHVPQGAFHHIAAQFPGHPKLEIPPVIKTTAETGEGMEQLASEIMNHRQALIDTGFLDKRRKENLVWELGRGAAERVLSKLEKKESKTSINGLASEVMSRSLDFYEAIDALESSLA